MTSNHIQSRIIELDFITLTIYDNYAIGETHEGVFFSEIELKKITTLFEEVFNGEPFGYISNRKNNYKLDTSLFSKFCDIPNLVGIAVCCHHQKCFNSAGFEKSFFKKPFLPFFEMEACEGFIKNLLK